jgi:hypothetical protein
VVAILLMATAPDLAFARGRSRAGGADVGGGRARSGKDGNVGKADEGGDRAHSGKDGNAGSARTGVLRSLRSWVKSLAGRRST